MTTQPRLGPIARAIARAHGFEVPEPEPSMPLRKALEKPEPFVQEWRKRLTNRDETGRAVA